MRFEAYLRDAKRSLEAFMTDSKDALNEALKNFKAPTPPVASVTPRPEMQPGRIKAYSNESLLPFGQSESDAVG